MSHQTESFEVASNEETTQQGSPKELPRQQEAPTQDSTETSYGPNSLENDHSRRQIENIRRLLRRDDHSCRYPQQGAPAQGSTETLYGPKSLENDHSRRQIENIRRFLRRDDHSCRCPHQVPMNVDHWCPCIHPGGISYVGGNRDH